MLAAFSGSTTAVSCRVSPGSMTADSGETFTPVTCTGSGGRTPWVTLMTRVLSPAVMVTFPERDSAPELPTLPTFTDAGCSEAVPPVGERWIHLASAVTVQSWLTVKRIVLYPPSAGSSMESEPSRTIFTCDSGSGPGPGSGFSWQPVTAGRVQASRTRMEENARSRQQGAAPVKSLNERNIVAIF